jgi:hypothetical protein
LLSSIDDAVREAFGLSAGGVIGANPFRINPKTAEADNDALARRKLPFRVWSPPETELKEARRRAIPAVPLSRVWLSLFPD